MIAGAAWVSALMVAMLGLPLPSVLVVSVLLETDALTLMPLVIVAVGLLRRLGPAPSCPVSAALVGGRITVRATPNDTNPSRGQRLH